MVTIDLLFWLATFWAMTLYMQVIINRDKKHRRTQAEYVRFQKAEKRRLIAEAKLKNTRIKSDKVCYLDDYRQIPSEPKVI